MKKIAEILNSLSKDKYIHAECGEIIAIITTLIASMVFLPFLEQQSQQSSH